MRMILTKYLAGSILCSLVINLVCATADAAEKPPLKVLFIGNSQMSHYGLPQMLEAISAASNEGPRIKTGNGIVGGKSLKGHWESGTGEGTPRGMIAAEKWDYVVIQDIYAHVDNKPDRQVFEDYATRFDHAIRRSGSKTIIFATASVTEYTIATYRYPDSFKELNDMQISFAAKMGIPVAAGGYAWIKYLGSNPTLEQRLDLYDKDKGHPGAKGTYIYACLLYAVLTGISPDGLPCEFKNIRGGISIPKDEAMKMQQAAWEQYKENKQPLIQSETPANPANQMGTISKLKKELESPGKFTPDMEVCEKRIDASDAPIRGKVVEGMADMIPGLSGETWKFLVEATEGGDAELRQTALRGLIISVPTDKVTELLNRTEVLALIEPKIKRMRELFADRKWQVLINEFKDADLAAWKEKSFAAEALSLRGECYLNLNNGKEAEADLSKAIEILPANTNAWFKLAENYEKNLKDERKAAEAYVKVNELTKGAQWWMTIASVLKASAILRKLGSNEEALKILETADREKGSSRIQVCSAYLDTLTALGRKTDAVAECNKFLKLNLTAAEKEGMEKKLKELQGDTGQAPVK